MVRFSNTAPLGAGIDGEAAYHMTRMAGQYLFRATAAVFLLLLFAVVVGATGNDSGHSHGRVRVFQRRQVCRNILPAAYQYHSPK